MVYFKILSFVLGALMLAGGLGVSFYPRGTRDWIDTLYPEKRPRWLFLASAAISVLTLWTWYQFLINLSMEAFVITLVMSLTATKIVLAGLFYNKFREVAKTLIAEPLALRIIMLSAAAGGLGLLFLTFLIQ